MSDEIIMPRPYEEGFFKADNHNVKWYRYGSSTGVPTLFLHGGPGSGFKESYTTLFDLEKTDLITFDQRGSGQSTPHGSMENNTTQKLIEDIETLRKNLGVTSWVITGHSWGSTLALLYAQAYPEHVKAVTVCGLFLARRQDYDWSFNGSRMFFAPELEDLKNELGASDYGDAIVDRAIELMTKGTQDKKVKALLALSIYNAPFCRLVPESQTVEGITDASIRQTAIMLCYYQKAFDIRENQICDDVKKLNDIPVTLVHGRLDMDCPVNQAFAFKQAYPKTNLIVVQASHSLNENPLQSIYRQAIAETQRNV